MWKKRWTHLGTHGSRSWQIKGSCMDSKWHRRRSQGRDNACIVVAIRYGRRDQHCKCGPADCQNQSYQSLCRRIFLSEQFLSLPCGILRHMFPISRSRFPSGKVCGPNDRVQFLHLAANQAKRRGRQIKMRPDWEDRKLTIMHNLLVHKFNENLELIPKLLDTGGAVLVEGNTLHDNY
ncbi:NADAR family protein [Dysosmobacter welbionis]|uniref:NADAR family protein n=1 Tax=Dysosmobacter welbionis TaxID=2093857 RepID=UPI003A903A64